VNNETRIIAGISVSATNRFVAYYTWSADGFYRGRASVMPASCPRAPRVVCAELKPKRKSSSA